MDSYKVQRINARSEMKRDTATICLIIILVATFFMRQYRLLDFPYYGDEVDQGDIALEILHGNLLPFYPQNEGNEPLYHFSLAPFFAILGDSVIANRWPSVMWSMVFVALMYVYGRVLFRSRRAGVMAAGLTAALWWSSVFGHLGLRVVTMPPIMVPALLGLVVSLRDVPAQRVPRLCIVGGIFAGLTAYTYTAGRGFPIIVVVFLLYAVVFKREALRRRWHALFVYFVLMVIVSVPLYLYLFAHPAEDYRIRDLTALSWMAQGDMQGMFSGILDTVAMFTVRGEPNWVYSLPYTF